MFCDTFMCSIETCARMEGGMGSAGSIDLAYY